MDDKLTEKIAAYVEADAVDRNILAGAELFLKLSKNRILYTNIVRAPQKFAGKLLYELEKHLAIRLQRQTVRDVAVMDKQLSSKSEALIAKGKRSDHDDLPLSVQQFWDNCAALYKKIKQLHEHLKTLCDAAPCDRAELLYQLRDMDHSYHTQMQLYDDYVLGSTSTEPTSAPTDEQLASSLDNARKYLSKYKTKLAELRAEDSTSKKYTSSLARVQARYDLLVQANQEISDELRAELQSAGVVV